MAGRALPRRLVVFLLDVTGQAEGADRDQCRDPGRGMAGVAPDVGGAGVRRGKVSAGVALDAASPLVVMLDMTALTGSHAVGRGSIGWPVTVGAGHIAVGIVTESDGSANRRAGAYPHRDFGGARLGELVGAMAAGAVPGLDPPRDQPLVMAEVAAPGNPEDQPRSGPVHDVAGEAGEGRMTGVGEGIARGGLDAAG